MTFVTFSQHNIGCRQAQENKIEFLHWLDYFVYRCFVSLTPTSRKKQENKRKNQKKGFFLIKYAMKNAHSGFFVFL